MLKFDAGNEQQVLQSGGTLNMKGVYLHLISDMLGSIVVIAAALTIHFFDGKQWTLYIDPIMRLSLNYVRMHEYRSTFQMRCMNTDLLFMRC